MNGFHIDMNGALYPKQYLVKWLEELADLNYDTILWEVENGIQWETCPECVAPDAFSKSEFKEILQISRDLGFENIPLFQTIGHAEYVLKNKEYLYLSELSDNFQQYCPLKDEVKGFLNTWIHEYYEIFGDVKYFHIGADEAYNLGECSDCKEKATNSSLSKLYIDHINETIKPILEKGSIPIIWADMVLHHFDALDSLDKRILLFDWNYGKHNKVDTLHIWGKKNVAFNNIPEETMKEFGDYIFPDKNSTPEIFYTADYLANKGFQVVTCPASSHYGDNIFASRAQLHFDNCFDSIAKSKQSHLSGFMLTSWTVHMFPWELQRIFIAIPSFLKENPNGAQEEYKKWYENKYFQASLPSFWKAVDLISTPVLGSRTRDTVHNKSNLKIEKEAFSTQLQKAETTTESTKLNQTIKEFEEALSLFQKVRNENSNNTYEVDHWILATKNLITRSQGTLQLLGENQKDNNTILKTSQELKTETEKMYQDKLSPIRRSEIIHWIYDSFHHALEN
ncbi:MAG: hypothetical protein COA79_03780 [Planctomycetota bacterium]|nr:MAG: hypothetical protein COA79_03780 [Planctomycetota bacterium]